MIFAISNPALLKAIHCLSRRNSHISPINLRQIIIAIFQRNRPGKISAPDAWKSRECQSLFPTDGTSVDVSANYRKKPFSLPCITAIGKNVIKNKTICACFVQNINSMSGCLPNITLRFEPSSSIAIAFDASLMKSSYHTFIQLSLKTPPGISRVIRNIGF